MQINHLSRRDFVTLIGGAAVTWPLAARAQQPKLPRIGVLVPANPEPFWSEFRAGLSQHGNRTQLYTSRGTGFWGPPLRVFAPSEITVLTLRAA